MKIVVLGAGVVGTAAAYYLAADGHDLVVGQTANVSLAPWLDRRAGG